MNVVEFRLETEELGVGTCTTVGPYVDGVHLRDLARVVEGPSAIAAGQPDLAGGYAGLGAIAEICWPSRHFLGEPVEQWFDDGDTVLLDCICGGGGCWPLTAHVDVDATTVRWRDFRMGHRDWDLSELGPFTFARDQYDEALRATELR